MGQLLKKPDLEERTAKFGEEIITICKKIKKTEVSKPLISQLVRSATSIGANYMEASGASSRKDFINKIYLCKKESQETKHWLRMMARCEDDLKGKLQLLWSECQQLTLIFNKIAGSARRNINN